MNQICVVGVWEDDGAYGLATPHTACRRWAFTLAPCLLRSLLLSISLLPFVLRVLNDLSLRPFDLLGILSGQGASLPELLEAGELRPLQDESAAAAVAAGAGGDEVSPATTEELRAQLQAVTTNLLSVNRKTFKYRTKLLESQLAYMSNFHRCLATYYVRLLPKYCALKSGEVVSPEDSEAESCRALNQVLSKRVLLSIRKKYQEWIAAKTELELVGAEEEREKVRASVETATHIQPT